MLGHDFNSNKNFCCTKASDTNKTLETTFRFILEHQINSDSSINYTSIFLGLSSLNSLSLSNPTNRSLAFNNIFGFIKKVTDSYVVILAKSACAGKLDEFVIAYSDIDTFNSQAIKNYYTQYVLTLEKLPPICVDYSNSYYNILNALTLKLDELKTNIGLDIFIIYASLFSQRSIPSTISIVKNLVIFDNLSIIPITTIGGFFTVPSAPILASTEDGGAL